MERLQRVLASRGVTSRRKAEELILEGRVTVNGEVVRELGTVVDPDTQDIRVDGQRLRPERRRYVMLNKPSGYITTMSDERGRRTVMELVDVPERVVPVGRLDRATSGLLLLTNDGDLAFRMTHPRYELQKEYEALLDGYPPPEVLQRLRVGVSVEGQRVVPDQVRPMRAEEGGTLLRIVIHEGRNRIVRRMLDYVGYPALSLTRTRIGPLHVRGLATGAWRDLTEGEVAQLLEAVHLVGDEATPTRRPSAGPPAAQRPRRPFVSRPGAPPSGRGPRDTGGRPDVPPVERRGPRPVGPPSGGQPADGRGREQRGAGPARPPWQRDREQQPAAAEHPPRRPGPGRPSRPGERPVGEQTGKPAREDRGRPGPGGPRKFGRRPEVGRNGGPSTSRGPRPAAAPPEQTPTSRGPGKDERRPDDARDRRPVGPRGPRPGAAPPQETTGPRGPRRFGPGKAEAGPARPGTPVRGPGRRPNPGQAGGAGRFERGPGQPSRGGQGAPNSARSGKTGPGAPPRTGASPEQPSRDRRTSAGPGRTPRPSRDRGPGAGSGSSASGVERPRRQGQGGPGGPRRRSPGTSDVGSGQSRPRRAPGGPRAGRGRRPGGPSGQSRTFGRRRGSDERRGGPSGGRNRRPGGGRQDDRGQRGGPPA
ncbi:MAG TPA: pseudouridine synthase [Thermomicrobiaceae bacterium]|nr:pseudouridine synthase [Thermomicrobiaceae bacterium]